MTDAVKQAIEDGDAEGLARLVGADPALASAQVSWGPDGKNRVPPLHFVCDAVFRKLCDQRAGLAMAEVLIGAGVDVHEVYAKSGDHFLIAAASLGAELVGVRLVEEGVDVHQRGLFGATALHWAAFMGLPDLVRSLCARGAPLELHDEKYDCTPLQWAVHAWTDGTNGFRERIPVACATLRRHGATVPSSAGAALTDPKDAALRSALGLG